MAREAIVSHLTHCWRMLAISVDIPRLVEIICQNQAQKKMVFPKTSVPPSKEWKRGDRDNAELLTDNPGFWDVGLMALV